MNQPEDKLPETIKSSPLYGDDLAPIAKEDRTWSMMDMAAIWVGMAVCIPTYLLASYMIKSGLNWIEALVIILLGNVIITIPMILNGHSGVKYGIPFPVIGRAAFGTKGIHLASVVRGIVACGWFGIQTWIGGLAVYAIYHAVMGTEGSLGLDAGKFIGFIVFWLLNVYFIWKGTESIKWLEKFAAPILVGIGILLIGWGASTAGGFKVVLDQSQQLGQSAATISFDDDKSYLNVYPTTNGDGSIKAEAFTIISSKNASNENQNWINIREGDNRVLLNNYIPSVTKEEIVSGNESISVQFKRNLGGKEITSGVVLASVAAQNKTGFLSKIWSYLLWLTAMVGFWATMAISIADITRYTATQKNQILGQFIGLPGTMALFSFVGIFVTCAALINFQDILISEDAPWDPVSLLAKFDNPSVVIIAQIFMIIATLSTNIAANVIAPANAFSNLAPSKISFRSGGIIAAVIGILIMPWWLLDEISGLLIFVSGFLGPVLGILICDYFIVRNKSLDVKALFDPKGKYAYGNGYNKSAMIAFGVGIAAAMIGLLVPALAFLYTLSWFTGFIIALGIYYILMKNKRQQHIEVSG